MADDTNILSGDRIAADLLTTLNGAVTEPDSRDRRPKAQRIKPGFGPDGDFTDVDADHPFPVRDAAAANAIAVLVAYVDGLEALLGRLPADPATGTKLDQLAALLNTQAGYLDALEPKLDQLHTDLTATLQTREAGTYGYAAGSGATTIDVPTGARIKRVSVLPGDNAGATVQILGGATITVPAKGGFDELIPGGAVATSSTSDVVIGGTVTSYYVAWVV